MLEELPYVGILPVTVGERRVLVVELVRRDPVVVSHRIIRQIERQLLQRGVIQPQRIRRGCIASTVRIREEHHRIMLGRVVVLV